MSREYDAERLARREEIAARLRGEKAEREAAQAEEARERAERRRREAPELRRLNAAIRREMIALEPLLAGGDDDLDGEYRSGLAR